MMTNGRSLRHRRHEKCFLAICQATRHTACIKIYPVREFKTHFSEIIEQVRVGEEIIIRYGKKKENIAVLIPYTAYKPKKIRLGLLQDKVLKIHGDFKMSEEALLGL